MNKLTSLFRLPQNLSASSSDNDHTLSFLLLKLASKAAASLEAFLPPSSLSITLGRTLIPQETMSQTLTAIAHPLASKAIPPLAPQMWHRDILPYRLQARQRGSTPQTCHQDTWIQRLDQDSPPLRPPKRDQVLPSMKQLQGYPAFIPPMVHQWDRSPPSLGPPIFQYDKHKLKYRDPVSLSIPTTPDRPVDTRVKQPYEAFLVLDIEGTCELGTDFNYPNEIIEFPVCLLQWVDRSDEGLASELRVVDEFRSFVKPTWRPVLSDFCKQLTGITQDLVDSAPHFPEVLAQLEAFLIKNGLIDEGTRKRLKKFCWCSDGPCDVRDFAVKQCFISKVKMPSWLESDVLDIRSMVIQYLSQTSTDCIPRNAVISSSSGLNNRSLNIPAQLRVLGLPTFEGREHSGIDDTRNVSKVLIELARQSMCLLPNSTVRPNRRWAWMGKEGQILEASIKP